jgi:hypothetical protein
MLGNSSVAERLFPSQEGLNSMKLVCSSRNKICCGIDSSGSGWGPVAVTCEESNEPTGSIKGGGFIDQLSDYQFLKKYSVSCS